MGIGSPSRWFTFTLHLLPVRVCAQHWIVEWVAFGRGCGMIVGVVVDVEDSISSWSRGERPR